MNRMKNAVCVMLCVATPLLTVARQNRPDERPLPAHRAEQAGEKQRALDPLAQKILLILNRVLEAQKGFADTNLRISIRVQIADMLWPYDEPRARRLFEEALESLAAANLAERIAATSSSSVNTGSIGLAFNAIRTVTRRDPALAAKLGESLVDSPFNADQRPYGPNGDLRYILAIDLSPEDPQRAAQVAKPFAERGELNKLIPFIRGLRTRDPKAADELFFQGFEKARLGEPSVDDIRWLASYVFPGFGEGVLSFSFGGGDRDTGKRISPGTAATEQFLELAYNTLPVRLEQLLANAEGDRSFFRFPRDYATARLLFPQFELFLPDRAPAFRARVESARRRVPPERQHNMTLHEPGTVSELLARADALSDPRDKDILYQRAAENANMGGDVEQASVIVEKIVDESIRSSQIERINNNRFDDIQKALKSGDFDKAEKLIAQVSFGRMWMLGSLIAGLFKKDRPRALQLLEAERRNVDRIDNGAERVLHRMTLVGVIAGVDMNRAFEEMTIAVGEFNRAGFAPEWEKYQDTTREVGGQNANTRLDVGLRSLSESNFQWLGSSDFDRALGVAQQLEMREASALAQLAVCRGALSRIQPVTPSKPISPPKQQER